MRHRKSFNHLGRKKGHRKAMLANMASSLIVHKRIKTTVAKAKALRSYVEPLLTKSKNLSSVDEKMHAQRTVFSYLQDKEAVKEMFTDVAPKIEKRPGGYTRIIKLGNRIGDNAEMCFIELVDFNETMLADAKASSTKSTKKRSRRGGSTKSAPKAETAPVSDTLVEDVEEVKEEAPKAEVEKKEDDNKSEEKSPEKE